MRSIEFEREEFTEKEKRNIEIMEILRRRGPISRPDISKEMGINVVTISHYLDDFIKHKLVQEKELDISEGGRPPTLLDLNVEGGYIIGAGLNLTNMVGVLVDLKNNIVFKTQVNCPGASAKEVAECILDIIREIIRRSKEYLKGIKGIGVGIAGIIDKKNNTIRWPERAGDSQTNYTSINVPLKELIEKEFGLPVLIENDATAACFGEQRLQLAPGIKNVVYMFSGVGSGIMINGELYTGSGGSAGELSIYNYKEDQLFNCEMGKPCFLKRWETDLGIVEDAKSILAKDKQAAEEFFKLTSANLNNIDLKRIFVANAKEHAVMRSVLDKAAKRLGIRIAYIVNLLNPQVVIIGGGLEEAGKEFLSKVTSTVKAWAFREATEELKIIYSQLRENAVAMGAASLVTQKIFARLL